MDKNTDGGVNYEELMSETAEELPQRHLLATVTILGFPIVGVSDVAVNADTSGPGWLIST